MQRTKIIKPGKRGQALVEFALILPVLIILALLIVQYAIIYRTAISLTNLSREGGRYAAASPALDSAIDDQIQAVTPPNINYSDIKNNITVLPAQGSSTRIAGSGANITVTITYNMGKKIFLPSTFFGVKLFAQTYTTQATFVIQ